MYGLSKDFDFSIFVGRTLEMVSFTANTAHLSFDQNLSITIESSYEYQVDSSDSGTREEIPIQKSTLMQLLEKTVETAEVHGKGTLVLHFEGGLDFKCFDDSPQYEAYCITNRGKETYV